LLCNATKGIRINDNSNWYREISITEKENATFTEVYFKLNNILLNTPIAFTFSGNYMCFVTSSIKVSFIHT
jgi:hypothetical protein